MKKTIYILFWFITITKLNAQSDYILQSKAPLPKEFNYSVDTRLAKATAHLKELGIQTNADVLKEIIVIFQGYFRSGQVLFNDTISYYIEKIGDRLIDKDRVLYNKLKFYLCKSSDATSFSSPDGCIYISTGFIAQATNESQIAFALAREIAKYKLGFIQTIDVDYLSRLKAVKSYNHFYHEFTTQLYEEDDKNSNSYDKDALALIDNAGFSKSDAIGYFDVMQYAHLPFDIVKFDKSFFETTNFTIPAEYNGIITGTQYSKQQTKNEYEVRKQFLQSDIFADTYTPKVIPREIFIYISGMARIESCRQELLQKNYPSCIYNSYCLLKTNPKNVQAKEMFIHSLYGFSLYNIEYSYKNNYKKNESATNYSDTFINFLYQLKANNTNNLAVLALSKCYQWSKEHPQSGYLSNMKDILLAHLYTNTDVNKSFFEFNRNSKTIVDSVKKNDDLPTGKYSKLKKNKETENEFKSKPNAFIKKALIDICNPLDFERDFDNAIAKTEYFFGSNNSDYTSKNKQVKIKDRILQTSFDFDYINLTQSTSNPTRNSVSMEERKKIEYLFITFNKQLGGRVINMSVEDIKLNNAQMWNDECMMNDYFYELSNGKNFNNYYVYTQYPVYIFSMAKGTPYLFSGKFTKKIYYKDTDFDEEDCYSCNGNTCLIPVFFYNQIVPTKRFLIEYYIIDAYTGRRVYYNESDDFIPFKMDMVKAHIYDMLYKLEK